MKKIQLMEEARMVFEKISGLYGRASQLRAEGR
jgi:hypothetical protein